MLEETLQLAGAGIDVGLTRGKQAVPVARIVTFLGAVPSIPRRRVPGTYHHHVLLDVKAGSLPRGTAAMVPGIDHLAILVARPGRCFLVTRRRAFLAIQATHVAFDHRAGPDLLAGIRVAGEQVADDAEFIPRGTMHQQHFAGFLVLDDERRASHRIANLVIAKFLRPDHLAGVLVERGDASIQSTEEDLVAIDGRTAVNHIATGTDIVRQASSIFPEALAGFRFDRKNARIGAGCVDHAIMHQHLPFLTALLFTAKGEAPGRHQIFDVFRVDRSQRAVALRLEAKTIRQDIAGGLVVIENIFPAYFGASRYGRGTKGGGHEGGKQRLAGIEAD